MNINGCSPFAKTDGLWFNAAKEAETQEYEIYKAEKAYFKKHKDGYLRPFFTTDSSDAYYDAKYKAYEETSNFDVNIEKDINDKMLHVKLGKADDAYIEL